MVLPHSPFLSSSPTSGRLYQAGFSPRGRGDLGDAQEPTLYFCARPPAGGEAPGCWAQGVWEFPAQLWSGSLELGLTGRVWGGAVRGSPWNTLEVWECLGTQQGTRGQLISASPSLVFSH